MLYKVLITPLYDEKKLAVSKLKVNNNKTITKKSWLLLEGFY